MMYNDFDINPRRQEEPKHGFFQTGVTKGYGKRWKLKGMQRLRWYCQVCNKQCKDANGFKCHKTSRPHLEMMASAQALFAEDNGENFVDHYSQEFEGAFLATLKKKFGETRVLAEAVYEAYLDAGAELPLTDTMWDSIPHFVTHLVKNGRVLSDDTPEGPLIRYIPQPGIDHWMTGLPTEKKKKEKKEVVPESDDVIKQRRIEAMIKAAESQAPPPPIQEATELKKDENQVIAFGFGSSALKPIQKQVNLMGEEDEDSHETKETEKDKKQSRDSEKRRSDRERDDGRKPSRDRDSDRDRERNRERSGERERRDRDDRREDRRDRDHDKRGDTRSRDHPYDRDDREKRYRERDTRDERDDRHRAERDHRGDRDNRKRERDPRDERDDRYRKDSREHKDDKKDRRAQEDHERQKRSKLGEVEEVAPPPKVEKEVILENWLTQGLVVKVMHQEILGGRLYKRKGVVVEMVDDFVGVVKMLDGDEEKLKIDQEFLETVIPAIGATVRIVNGKFRGKYGMLESVNIDEFKAVVRVGNELMTKEYEHICKVL